ncbi:hypothetical protein SCA6_019644 [Theobroma cacao]
MDFAIHPLIKSHTRSSAVIYHVHHIICSSAVCSGATLQLCYHFLFCKVISGQDIPATYMITSGSIDDGLAMWKRLTTDLYLRRQVFCLCYMSSMDLQFDALGLGYFYKAPVGLSGKLVDMCLSFTKDLDEDKVLQTKFQREKELSRMIEDVRFEPFGWITLDLYDLLESVEFIYRVEGKTNGVTAEDGLNRVAVAFLPAIEDAYVIVKVETGIARVAALLANGKLLYIMQKGKERRSVRDGEGILEFIRLHNDSQHFQFCSLWSPSPFLFGVSCSL